MRPMRFFLLFLIFLAGSSHANITAEVDSITIGPAPAANAHMYYYDYAIYYDGSTKEYNPCYGLSKCFIYTAPLINGSKSTAYDGVFARDSSKYPCMLTVDNLTDLFNKCVYAVWPITGIAKTEAKPSESSPCVALVYSTTDYILDGVTFPTEHCVTKNINIYTACTLPSTINLDHGTLSSNKISGSESSQSFSITCNSDVSAAFHISGLSGDTLSLGGGVNSALSLNGSSLSSSGLLENFTQGTHTLTIKSKLSASGNPSAGKHTGQAVLTMSLQ